MPAKLGTALVTGASSGIGATYADRLAKRGYDLILVARDIAKLQTLAARLEAETGATVRSIKADLTDRADLRAVEQVLREDAAITLLVNNAGMAALGPFSTGDIDVNEAVIDLNVTALTRLSHAAVTAFLARGGGSIVNIASVLAFGHDLSPGVYSATKSYVVTFSRGLNVELAGKGVYVQAVLPAATRTEIWEKSGISADSLPAGPVMGVDDLVDAALVGFDNGELVTLPSLPDDALWRVFDQARSAMMSDVRHDKPAARYREAVKV